MKHPVSYQTRSLTTTSTKYDDIRKAIDNNHAFFISTTYVKDNKENSHAVLCVVYKMENGENYSMHIYDPGFENEKDGVYWTSTVDSKSMTYSVTQTPANNYGTVTINNAMYITKG